MRGEPGPPWLFRCLPSAYRLRLIAGLLVGIDSCRIWFACAGDANDLGRSYIACEIIGIAAYAGQVRLRLIPGVWYNWWAANHVPPALSPRISRGNNLIGAVSARGMIR